MGDSIRYVTAADSSENTTDTSTAALLKTVILCCLSILSVFFLDFPARSEAAVGSRDSVFNIESDLGETSGALAAALTFTVLDASSGDTLSARCSVLDENLDPRYPDPMKSLFHTANGGYFYTEEACHVTVEPGTTIVRIGHGFEYEAVEETLEVLYDTTIVFALNRIVSMDELGWFSGDCHVHINHYGGFHTMDPSDAGFVCEAEGLNIINCLDNEYYFTGQPDSCSSEDCIVSMAQESRLYPYGHAGILGLNSLIEPFSSAWSPLMADVAELAHDQPGAAIIAAHPISTADFWQIDGWPGTGLARELPVDMLISSVDGFEVMSYSNCNSGGIELDMWYRLLNCGFRLSPCAGTDACINRIGDLPAGGVRTYVDLADAVLSHNAWISGLSKGKTFVTNGPLFSSFEIDDHLKPGDKIALPAGDWNLPLTVSVVSAYPLERLEIVQNGEVAERFVFEEGSCDIDTQCTIHVVESAWVAARVFGPNDYWLPIGDSLFAHTGPVYISVGGEKTTNPNDAAYIAQWVADLESLAVEKGDWPAPSDSLWAMQWFAFARAYYEYLALGEAGPVWYYRTTDLFQDNFPDDVNDIESFVRADAARDITPLLPGIVPEDCIEVECSSPWEGGIAQDPGGGPAVYMHVKCSYIGPVPMKPPLLFGAGLQGSCGTYKSDDGTWTIIQCAGAGGNRYRVDLNDGLFTRGYRIEYYFTARDNNGLETALPQWARSRAPYFEWTCLPTLNSDVLFVNDCDDIAPPVGPVEVYWKSRFNAVLPLNNQPDIYHVNAPDERVSNGLGSRAKYMLGGVANQLFSYRKIVWDSGRMSICTISDGTPRSDKSNDCELLQQWIVHNPDTNGIGLWICGDDVAEDLAGGAPVALSLLGTWCGVQLLRPSFFPPTVNPKITGDVDAATFVHAGVSDWFHALGAGPPIRGFDVLDRVGNGMRALDYPNGGYAGIASTCLNAKSNPVRTMWFAFSFMCIVSPASSPQPAFHIAGDVFAWMNNEINADLTPAVMPRSNKLAQNFPNPFNPSTSIKFDVKDKGVVTLNVYSITGQLIRTLVNGVKDAGCYTVIWDGKNNRGTSVASGIYFYKMETKGFSETKKIVMVR